MLDQRISYEIDRQKSKNKSLLIVIILTIAAISALSFYTIFILRKILIQQNKELDHKVAERDKELNLRYQELKQNHIKLGEAEQKFRSLVENSLVGVYIAPEGKLAYVNPKFQEIFEYEYDELIGKDIYSLIYPEDVAIAKEKVRLREEKKVDGVQYEIRCITKTGRIIWIELFGSITLYNGNPALSGTLLDITESKTAQDEVKKRESEFRAFFDNLESASCLLDADKKYVLFNRRFAQDYFNLTNVEPKPGMEAYDFFPPEVKIARNLVIDRVMQTGKKEDIEVDYHKHGKFISYRTSFNPVLKDGKVIGIATLSVDLTQIKQVKAEIIKSQANMKSILDNTEVGFLLLDINYHVITSNKRFDNGYAKAFGIDFKKDVSYFKQIDEDRIETVLDYFERVKTQRIPVGWESSIDGANGLFYFNTNLMPVMNENEIIGFSMSVTDITERKSLEIEREQITNDLMQRNKDLEQFAYITSHNLRAPIANIIGISELLEEPAVLEDERKDLNQSLIYSVSRLDQVVADLNIILQTKREIDETKKNVNLYDLVSLVKDSIKNLIEHNDVSIICRFDQGAKEFFTIKTYLYSIFYNLISNSIKYRKQNQPCLIQIESKVVRNKFILVFKDNGIGIDLEKYGEKVFKLYKRFHLNIEGKGMGLYMVKTQVETLGGKISISSRPDVGTEFVIEFPM